MNNLNFPNRNLSEKKKFQFFQPTKILKRFANNEQSGALLVCI